MRHIVSLLVENEAGALSRISGLFSARGYNIESLTVATTEDPTLSRMTIITNGSERIIEQITKQLHKLIDVVKLQDMTEGNFIERDFYSEWPITINVNGSYHNLALFFDRISRFSRILNIDNLQVSALKRGDGSHTISAKFQAKTFIYKEPPAEEPGMESGGVR